MFNHCIVVSAVVLSVSCGCCSARAERIHWSEPNLSVLPGGTVAGMVLLDESTTPLFGYSLDIRIMPLDGAVGTITVDTATTNFFDSRNLVTAGGFTRDPIFSVIQSTADGVFISTNSADLSTVTAAPGLNDALAQVFFRASAGALGEFQVRFGSGTALSDGLGSPVTHMTQSLSITVIPSPASVGGLILGAVIARSRRRRS